MTLGAFGQRRNWLRFPYLDDARCTGVKVRQTWRAVRPNSLQFIISFPVTQPSFLSGIRDFYDFFIRCK